ncbi:MAG: HD domain-containing phosphohydrolase [Chromatiaceae bacterium]
MYNKGRILAVDDTPASLKLVTDLLKAEGFEVRSAISGELALHAAVSNPPELVLLDIRMPVMDGPEVCRRLKADSRTREVPVIFVSAASEIGEKLVGFEVGAVDYVTKPYQRDELLARVRTHLELYRLRHRLEGLVEARTAALLASERRVRDSLLETITAFAVLVEMRDPYTAGHQRRVAHLAAAIAKEMQMTDQRVEGVRLAGAVHDIGKIQIPTEILSKPGRLTHVEFELIKQHAESGYDILKAINFPWPIAQIVRQHHERLDGSGYPQALTNDQILLEAKILAVADVVESMISHRPYRPGLGLAAAMAEIITHKGKLFDPAVVDACVRLFKELSYVLPD